MLLMQKPRLLLVDEPVAGMTEQETERTAELLTAWPAITPSWWWSTTWISSDPSPAR